MVWFMAHYAQILTEYFNIIWLFLRYRFINKNMDTNVWTPVILFLFLLCKILFWKWFLSKESQVYLFDDKVSPWYQLCQKLKIKKL